MATEEREKRDVRQDVTDRIIAAVEAGKAPWQRPHEGGLREPPRNAVTDRPYTGGNHLWLALVSPTPDPRWCTFAQAKAQGWQVKKGEHGYPIEVWKPYEKTSKLDMSERTPKEREALEKAGYQDGQDVKEQHSFAKIYTVFHASQIDGIPPLEVDQSKIHDFDLHTIGERLFERNEKSAPVLFDTPGMAFYQPSTDEVHLPPKDHFLDAGHLYATAAHEIAHSTMHPSRLNRDRYQEWEQGTAGDKTLRAKEELRAEIASYMISEKTGIPHHPENHESYVTGWVSILQDSKNEIYQAARDAEKIADYVIEQQKLLGIAAPEKVVEAEVVPIHLDSSDLIQFRDGNGVQKTGIVLREIDNRDSDKSIFFQYKAVTMDKDGKPVIQQAGNALGNVKKADILTRIPNAVPGIEKLDMQSKGFEQDATLRPGIKTALEYRVDSIMRDNHLTFENVEKNQVMEKQVYHKVILTHRTDLNDRVLQEPIDPDKPILEMQYHPRQGISGVLKDFSQSEFILKTEEFGDVRVETHKRMFADRTEELRALVGKPVHISIDATGKNLSVHFDQGTSILQDHFQTPLRPIGLMPMRHMSAKAAEPVSGTLTHVHDTNMLEVSTAKGPTIVYAADPDRAHQAEIKRLVGHQVIVNPGKTLQVAEHSVMQRTACITTRPGTAYPERSPERAPENSMTRKAAALGR
jgi:antirestriction protein ArdC